MIDMKKAKDGDRLLDVVSPQEFIINKAQFSGVPLAIERGQYFYPERTHAQASMGMPGVVDYGVFLQYTDPQTEQQKKELSVDNIINFNGSDIKDIIESSIRLKDAEREILTSPDNITSIAISEYDEPEMVALKKAIKAKHIDMDKYESRFGSKTNFNNDKRLLTKTNISIAKLKTISKNLDIQVTLTLSDMDGDIPNPMGEPISVNLIDANGDDE